MATIEPITPPSTILPASREPSRDAILGAKDTIIEFCPTPEWPCDVYVKSLNGSQRDSFEASLVKTNGKGRRSVSYNDVRAKLVVKTACDKDGKLLFSDRDIDQLTLKSASALQRVFEVAQRLSGITESDVQELTDELKNDQPEDLLSA
jgi:hypothetical protein